MNFGFYICYKTRRGRGRGHEYCARIPDEIFIKKVTELNMHIIFNC